jgi:HK97 family phage major capsid protein
MSATLVQKHKELQAKQKHLHDIFEQAGKPPDMSKVELLKDFPDSYTKAKEIARLNKEMTELGKECEALAALEGIGKGVALMGDSFRGTDPGMVHADGQPQGAPPVFKTLGDLFIESKALTEYKGGGDGPVGAADADVKRLLETKTLMETSAGWAPESLRTGRVVLSAQRPIRVVDLIPKATTTMAAVVYMVETTFTNSAAEVAEGGTSGEAALVLTETSETVRRFSVWIPVTDEQLEDVVFVRDYINQRLGYMLDARLDLQLLVGDGSAPNISGVHDRANINTQALGADTRPDAVYKAMNQVRTSGFATPTAGVFHPNDWQEIRLLRTGDGIYIWGAPMDAGPERIWGIPIVQSTAETETQAVVGDFAAFSQIAVRRGVDFRITDSHSDFFIKGKQAIRMDLRLAFMVYRHEAFCEITGL